MAIIDVSMEQQLAAEAREAAQYGAEEQGFKRIPRYSGAWLSCDHMMTQAGRAHKRKTISARHEPGRGPIGQCPNRAMIETVDGLHYCEAHARAHGLM